jgi:hypothetical protein
MLMITTLYMIPPIPPFVKRSRRKSLLTKWLFSVILKGKRGEEIA